MTENIRIHFFALLFKEQLKINHTEVESVPDRQNHITNRKVQYETMTPSENNNAVMDGTMGKCPTQITIEKGSRRTDHGEF